MLSTKPGLARYLRVTPSGLLRIEVTCGATWPVLRRELERIKLGTFAGPAGTFHQRTQLTTPQRAILAKPQLPEPPRASGSSPPAAATGS